MNLIKNKKGTVNLIAYVFYILLALSVLAIVVTSSLNIIEKHKQKNNYELMLKTINNLDNKIQEVSNNRFQRQEIIVNNPEELTIDCENNKIIGSVVYGSNFKTDQNVNINNIILYKKLGKIFFEKEINNSNNLINLNCNNLNLNKGKNTITVSYFDYNSQNEKIQIDIIPKRERTNNWYNSNWEYRQLLIIDSNYITGTVVNFPIPISLTSQDLKQKGKSDGSDIVFTSADGFTKLSREIEEYNSESGELIAFVKIPGNLDGNKNTNIYMYYGNRNGIEINDTTTWDDDFAAVFHMNNSTLDSTKNNIDGSIINTLVLSEDKFGKNNSFDFTNGYITIPKPFDQNNLEQIWTVDAWYKVSDKDNYQEILSSVFNRGCNLISATTKNPLLYLNSGANDYYTYGNGNYVNINTWEKITFRFRNSDGYRKIYVNGEDITTVGPNRTSTPLGIGNTISIGKTFRGSIDELRISTNLRSDDWIKTEYDTINNIEKLITIGEIEIR